MIITLGGPPGSGTSTLAKLLKEKLNLKYEYAGSIFRKTAKELNMSLENFGKYAEQHPEVDIELDNKMLSFAEVEGNHLLEGRMTGVLFHREKIPAFKIWVDASVETRAKRLVVRDGFTYEEAVSKMTERDECDRKRYLELYHLDPATSTCYDLVLNSENLLPEQLAEIICDRLKQN